MNSISILIIDDEKNVMSSLQRLFHDPKYKIFTATHPKDALTILQQNEIGIMICDYKLNETTGTDFLAETIPKWPDISRILLTGYFNSQIASHSLNKGEVYRFITKPWNDNELVQTIHASWKDINY